MLCRQITPVFLLRLFKKRACRSLRRYFSLRRSGCERCTSSRRSHIPRYAQGSPCTSRSAQTSFLPSLFLRQMLLSLSIVSFPPAIIYLYTQKLFVAGVTPAQYHYSAHRRGLSIGIAPKDSVSDLCAPDSTQRHRYNRFVVGYIFNPSKDFSSQRKKSDRAFLPRQRHHHSYSPTRIFRQQQG